MTGGSGGFAVHEVVVTPVAFPDPPLRNAVGVHQPWALRAIVQLRCQDGLVGLGETYGDAPHLALLHTAAAQLGGLDVFDLAGLRQRVARALGVADLPDQHGLTGASSPAKTLAKVVSPFEVACLDAQGHALGRPVVDLLGGAYRRAVPFSAYLFYKWAGHPGAAPDDWGEAGDPDGLVRQARRMIDRFGFTSIKLKGGVLPPAAEIEALQELRAAFPSHPLRLDPNCAWAPATARKVAERTAGLLEYLEDPTPGIAGMAQVAAAASMPLATNMCVTGFEDIPEGFGQRAVGVVLGDHHFWGGLRASIRLAGICQTWGVGLSMHSNSHLGVSLAAMVHVAAATPDGRYAADTHTPWQGGVDVVADPLSFVDGSVAVPAGPGLGVRLDLDALERMHRDYQRCGIRERDDTGYLRRVQPDFRRRQPRW